MPVVQDKQEVEVRAITEVRCTCNRMHQTKGGGRSTSSFHAFSYSFIHSLLDSFTFTFPTFFGAYPGRGQAQRLDRDASHARRRQARGSPPQARCTARCRGCPQEEEVNTASHPALSLQQRTRAAAALCCCCCCCRLCRFLLFVFFLITDLLVAVFVAGGYCERVPPMHAPWSSKQALSVPCSVRHL